MSNLSIRVIECADAPRFTSLVKHGRYMLYVAAK
jgi:hypothetical protein